eukprot:CAMPEP_0194528790 /NCGR_PEP_ID=MMETSP0253-20130528/65283_1 /TAXON_ID=2966 /ORGANISM="Noctiluca scintillans" /LENGTH=97 /DNA_ID=CAMNT_0039373875 /DNA_START=357 /DNA_END=652 /DNA_ORIENTATION=-
MVGSSEETIMSPAGHPYPSATARGAALRSKLNGGTLCRLCAQSVVQQRNNPPSAPCPYASTADEQSWQGDLVNISSTKGGSSRTAPATEQTVPEAQA